MAKNFIQYGMTVNFVPAEAVVSGAVVPIGGLLGVAIHDVAANESGVANISGVWQCAKVPSAVIRQGDPLVFKKATGLFDASASTQVTGDVFSGAFAFEDALAGTTSLAVKLSGVPGTVKA